MANIMSMQELFYGESEPAAYYGHMYPDLLVPMRGVREAFLVVKDVACDRYNQRVTGYRAPAHALGSGASASYNDGGSYRKSRLVQQGSRDRRSYVDSRDSQSYSRTSCPAYRGAAAITHYVSVNPSMATRVESGVAWMN